MEDPIETWVTRIGLTFWAAVLAFSLWLNRAEADAWLAAYGMSLRGLAWCSLAFLAWFTVIWIEDRIREGR